MHISDEETTGSADERPALLVNHAEMTVIRKEFQPLRSSCDKLQFFIDVQHNSTHLGTVLLQ